MEIHGVGFRAAVKGSVLDLSLGFSHPVEHPIPEGVSVKVEENTNIFVRKTGFEARIYSFAHNYSAFYGVFAIILAILAGYLAALSFRKI